MSGPLVTILIPNYRTLDLTKLCLRLLRKHTELSQIKVMVIDNDSQDDSLQYLRTLSWIQLIERKALLGELPAQSHARALDVALDRVITPYVLSIHTDTLIKHPKWLPFLMGHIKKRPTIAGVGSWKLEAKPIWRETLKFIERNTQLLYYRLLGKKEHDIQGVGKNYYYLRSYCALYRMDLLKRFNLHFSDGDTVAGKEMHKQLIDHGYEMIFLPSDVLSKYLEHINHATMALNPQLSSRTKSVNAGMRRIKKSLARMNAHAILLDERLDA